MRRGREMGERKNDKETEPRVSDLDLPLPSITVARVNALGRPGSAAVDKQPEREKEHKETRKERRICEKRV